MLNVKIVQKTDVVLQWDQILEYLVLNLKFLLGCNMLCSIRYKRFEDMSNLLKYIKFEGPDS